MNEISGIVNNHMLSLSFAYADQYQINGKVFIRCFMRFPSIRTACAFIVQSYKQMGIFDECKDIAPDFTGYVNKLDLPDRWRRVLGEILQIIYSIVKK